MRKYFNKLYFIILLFSSVLMTNLFAQEAYIAAQNALNKEYETSTLSKKDFKEFQKIQKDLQRSCNERDKSEAMIKKWAQKRKKRGTYFSSKEQKRIRAARKLTKRNISTNLNELNRFVSTTKLQVEKSKEVLISSSDN